MIWQLPTITTSIKITDFNVSKLLKEESQSLIKFYKLANSKCQISQQIQDYYLNKLDSILDINIIHETTVRYNQKC